MNYITLGYHDVVEDGSQPADGLRKAAHHYALHRTSFQSHLLAIRRRTNPSAVQTLETVLTTKGMDAASNQIPVFLTFDDGARGADTCAADELERLGWRGHFFIVTTWIGSLGFINERQIRELRSRGHVVGSHSHTHPPRMAQLDRPTLQREWKQSCSRLSDVLGEPVTTASIPNGYYSRAVADTAAEAGVRTLFTSEPKISATLREGCLILGRYAITSKTPGAEAGAIAAGDLTPRLGQAASWQAKKAAKAIGGSAYLKLRGSLMSSSRA